MKVDRPVSSPADQFTTNSELPILAGNCRMYFIRHGHLEESWKDKVYGQLDVPLSDYGRQKSDRLVFKLRSIPFRAVYSSDLARSLYMAEALVRLFGFTHGKEVRLRERNYGEWQGKSWEEIRSQYPKAIGEFEQDRSQQPPGGESLDQVAERVFPVLDEILGRHVGQDVAVICHAQVIRAIIRDALELNAQKAYSFSLKPCSVTVVDYRQVVFKGRKDPQLLILNG